MMKKWATKQNVVDLVSKILYSYARIWQSLQVELEKHRKTRTKTRVFCCSFGFSADLG